MVSLIGIAVLVLLVIGAAVAGATPTLGLDLRGGIHAIYTPQLPEAERPEDFDRVLDQTVTVIRQRVDALGVAEPNITRQGDNILVQLPNVDNPEQARDVIGTTAQLRFRPVQVVLPPTSPAYAQAPECPTTVDNPQQLVQQLGSAVQPTPAPTGTAPAGGGQDTGTPQSLGGATTGAVAAAGGDTVLAQSPDATPAPTPAPTATPGGQDDGAGAAGVARIPSDASAVLCGTSPGADGTGGGQGGQDGQGGQATKYLVGPSALSGERIEDAFATLGQGNQGGWSVSLELDDRGGTEFANITSELACRRDQGQTGLLAIVLDNRVESAPQMNPSVQCGTGITGGQASITVGQGSQAEQEEEARDLSLVLDTGSLPLTLEPSTFETVSPTLGAESLRSGLIAALIGLLLVVAYLIFFYRWLGLVALGALSIFGVLMYGMITLMGGIGFALTLAGIAGVVVSIGITADSSILFFERIREEASLGKTMRTGVKRAFESAFRTNLAGNTVTLAAAIVLYFLATGPVRGFALTLGIATVLDILILYFFTRSAVGLLSRRTGILTRASVRAPDAGTTAVEPEPGGQA